MEEKKNSLSQLMVSRSEVEHVLNNLIETREALNNNDIETAKKKVEDSIVFVNYDIEYMETFADCYPLEEMREIIKKCLDEKLVPFMTDEGIFSSKYENIIDQPVEGLLYDLNRDYATTYTLYSQRTLNDLGMAVLVTHLLNERQELKEQIKVLTTKFEV